ncbi:MAG: Ig-like domain-containing protein [Firmicutes bacterium]|nr:Ig-like domain-containing protein [Bacillota bacterium]
MRKSAYWLIGIALIGIVLGAVLLLNNTRQISRNAAQYALCEATLADAGGVDISSAFHFIFSENTSANAVRRFLVVEPAIELNFHQGLQATEVLVVPVEPLQTAQIYRFALQTESETLYWSFQTKQEWLVKKAFPAMFSTFIAQNSAIEIYFNQNLQADLNSLPDFFHIEPAVNGTFEQNDNCLRFNLSQDLTALTIYEVTLDAGLPALDSDLKLANQYCFAFETTASLDQAQQVLWKVEALSTFVPGQNISFGCTFFDQDNNTVQLAESSFNEAAKINAVLYHFPNTQAYAEDILYFKRHYPNWSYMGIYPQGTDIAGLKRLNAYELSIIQDKLGYSFQWPELLPEGCYLLQITYKGQNRDIRFQISSLCAYWMSSLEEDLLWVQNLHSGPANACRIIHINSGSTGKTNAEGLLRMKTAHRQTEQDAQNLFPVGEDVYLLLHENAELVLYDPNIGLEPAYEDIWQYIVLNQDIYSNGDNVDFWGYMRRRDHKEWEWNRVSVYIYAEQNEQEPIWQNYAPLKNNVFFGSIKLPLLLPGLYKLQIWQSGQMLISKDFMVEKEPVFPQKPTIENSNLLVVSDQEAYALDQEYTLELLGITEDTTEYLLIKSGNVIKEAMLNRQKVYRSVFGPDDVGGAYWQAVLFCEGKFLTTPKCCLLADASAYKLSIDAVMGDSTISFTIRQANGKAAPKADLLAMIAPKNRFFADMATTLYMPNQQKWFADKLYASRENLPNINNTITWGQKSLCFSALKTDKNGKAELQLPADIEPGEWQLYAFAVADEALPLAGNIQMPLTLVPTSLTDQLIPHEKDAEEWLFISSGIRIQAIELLSSILNEPDQGIEQCWAKLYSEKLLADICKESYVPLELSNMSNWYEYQQSAGGVSLFPHAPADAFLSLRAALLAEREIEVCDEAALSNYFKKQTMSSSSQKERAQALCALAALGQPVLQDIKLMLRNPHLLPLSKACLIWGLIEAGDFEAAKSMFLELRSECLSFTNSGLMYLAGGAENTIELNKLGAMLSAACKDYLTSFALLQYLQNQHDADPLTTVLTAGEVLRHSYAAPAFATLRTSYIFRRVEIEGNKDFCTKLPEATSVKLDNAAGDIAFAIVKH